MSQIYLRQGALGEDQAILAQDPLLALLQTIFAKQTPALEARLLSRNDAKLDVAAGTRHRVLITSSSLRTQLINNQIKNNTLLQLLQGQRHLPDVAAAE